MTDNSKISPTAIMRNVYAVYPSFAMLAGMQLDVFTPLANQPMQAGDLAKILHVKEEKLSPLLFMLVSADLLTVENGFFSNTQEANTFLVKGCADYIGGLSGFYNSTWHSVLKTAESIRTNIPQAKHDWTKLPKDDLIQYFRSQFPGSLKAGRQLAEKIDFTKSNRLIDVGGGSGGLSVGICKTYSKMEATLVDLPQVVSISKQFIAEAGLSNRITTVGADLVNSSLEGSFDVAVLRALLQVMTPEHAQKVLHNISRVIEPGGYIYIVGCVLDNTHLSPVASMAFSLVFLNVYDDGGAYTENQYHDWLTKAGFTDVFVEYEIMSDGLCLISAKKP